MYCAGGDGRGWEGRVTEGQGPFGVSTAEAARQLNIDRPLTDYKPGTGNGIFSSSFFQIIIDFLQVLIFIMLSRSITSIRLSFFPIRLKNSSKN